ncbi:hypothetical protein [Paenibacillus sp. 276b]|uniref:hypothetical protein n=1 Tax=Paenibacillus sp. 276b TaxID=1566277 RepID=UPI00089682B7|nr:hypothetical protein [Paenibacillus sp. 276b]SEB06567.1 hypothetical protein SAMN03159332_3234 [Paenibacillus sp. 276b]
MPGIDNYSLDNYGLDGTDVFPATTEQALYSVPGFNTPLNTTVDRLLLTLPNGFRSFSFVSSDNNSRLNWDSVYTIPGLVLKNIGGSTSSGYEFPDQYAAPAYFLNIVLDVVNKRYQHIQYDVSNSRMIRSVWTFGSIDKSVDFNQPLGIYVRARRTNAEVGNVWASLTGQSFFS